MIAEVDADTTKDLNSNFQDNGCLSSSTIESDEDRRSKYITVSFLSKGSYGVCFKVRDSESGKMFVRKCIIASDLEELYEIVNEVKVLSKFDSPQIISMVDFFIDRPSECSYRLNIITEYVKGGNLEGVIKKHLEQKKYMNETFILDIFSQICLGLDEIHKRKILHRDLKPSNIFLTDSNKIRIGDFGFSKILSSTLDKTTTRIGTPFYLSPEICQCKPYSFKSDIWSLGIILYELCMLKVPYTSTSYNGLIKEITSKKSPRLSEKFSKDLHNLIYQMLTVEESARISLSEIMNSSLIKSRVTYGIGNQACFTCTSSQNNWSSSLEASKESSTVDSNIVGLEVEVKSYQKQFSKPQSYYVIK